MKEEYLRSVARKRADDFLLGRNVNVGEEPILWQMAYEWFLKLEMQKAEQLVTEGATVEYRKEVSRYVWYKEPKSGSANAQTK